MNLILLEKQRKQELLKLFVLNFLNTALFVGIIFYVCTKPNTPEYIYYVTVLPLVAYGFINSIPKKFEKDIKKQLLPSILKNLVSGNDEIKWRGAQFEINETKESKVIDKLNAEIEKQCKIKSKTDDILEYCKSLEEKENLEKKENLTPQEQNRLQILKDDIAQHEEQTSLEFEQKYNIKQKMLAILENNSRNGGYSNNDLIKIEYLKGEIAIYDKAREQEQLQKKDLETLTEQDKKRLETLTQEIKDYYTKRDKNFESSYKESSIGLCLFEIFESCISYDDTFLGKYKNIDFVAIEGRSEGRAENAFFGTVIKIPLKDKFEDTLYILNKSTHLAPVITQRVTKELNKININQMFDKKYKVFSSTSNISNILDEKFMQVLSNQENKYSYVFKRNNAYLIWTHSKDLYKLGSLFKKIDDRKQYETFERDFRNLLNLIEDFASNNWALIEK